MNILLVEPFYSGSHKFFADQLKRRSEHNITLLTHEGKFWKWRMYGAALTLGEKYLEMSYDPDVILVTDMLDLPTFLSVIRRSLRSETKIFNYFHENQVAYPWKADSEDRQQKRDLHYAMLNYQSACVSDKVFFNSDYNRQTFLDGMSTLLKKMPDCKHTAIIESLRDKCTVLPLGLDLDAVKDESIEKNESIPLILWNHRWEHDKNPESFFKALSYVKNLGYQFKLALVGETYKSMPEIFQTAQEEYKDHLVHYGYATYDEYIKLLNKATILPVTSNHEFFGISVMEAIHCGATPLLPKRLSYVELYKPQENPEIFYESDQDLKEKLALLIRDHHLRRIYSHLTDPYRWDNMINVYDNLLKGHRGNTP